MLYEIICFTIAAMVMVSPYRALYNYKVAKNVLVELEKKGYPAQKIIDQYNNCYLKQFEITKYISADPEKYSISKISSDLPSAPDDLRVLFVDADNSMYDFQNLLLELGFTMKMVNECKLQNLCASPFGRHAYSGNREALRWGYEDETIPRGFDLYKVAETYKNEVIPKVYPFGPHSSDIITDTTVIAPKDTTIIAYDDTVTVPKNTTVITSSDTITASSDTTIIPSIDEEDDMEYTKKENYFKYIFKKSAPGHYKIPNNLDIDKMHKIMEEDFTIYIGIQNAISTLIKMSRYMRFIEYNLARTAEGKSLRPDEVDFDADTKKIMELYTTDPIIVRRVANELSLLIDNTVFLNRHFLRRYRTYHDMNDLVNTFLGEAAVFEKKMLTLAYMHPEETHVTNPVPMAVKNATGHDIMKDTNDEVGTTTTMYDVKDLLDIKYMESTTRFLVAVIKNFKLLRELEIATEFLIQLHDCMLSIETKLYEIEVNAGKNIETVEENAIKKSIMTEYNNTDVNIVQKILDAYGISLSEIKHITMDELSNCHRSKDIKVLIDELIKEGAELEVTIGAILFLNDILYVTSTAIAAKNATEQGTKKDDIVHNIIDINDNYVTIQNINIYMYLLFYALPLLVNNWPILKEIIIYYTKMFVGYIVKTNIYICLKEISISYQIKLSNFIRIVISKCKNMF